MCALAAEHTGLGGEDKQAKIRGCHTLGPIIAPVHPLSLPSIPCHTRTGVLGLRHIPAFLEVLAQAASSRERGIESVGVASVGDSRGYPVSAGKPQGPGAESELCYSRGWLLGVEGNGQREAGLFVVDTEETLTVSRIIDQIVPVGEQ